MKERKVEPIPDQPPVGAHPTAETRVYTLTMNPAGRRLGLKLLPPASVPQGDPLQMNVPSTGCELTIKLDPHFNWQFVEPYIEIGRKASQSDTPPRERYYKLMPGEKEVSFSAIFNANGPYGNTDPFNISVLFMEGENPVVMTIDPDILNPGDHP